MIAARHPLLDELEQHVEAKLAKVGPPEGGCVVLVAIELASAAIALEGAGITGTITVAGTPVEIGRAAP